MRVDAGFTSFIWTRLRLRSRELGSCLLPHATLRLQLAQQRQPGGQLLRLARLLVLGWGYCRRIALLDTKRVSPL